MRRALDKLFTSIWLTAIKQIDLENITAASGSSKLRGSVNKAERKKEFVKHRHLLPESEAKTQGKSINKLTPRGPSPVYVKRQITISISRLTEAGRIGWERNNTLQGGVRSLVALFTATVATLFLLPTVSQAGSLQLGAQILNLLMVGTIFLKAASRAEKKIKNQDTNAAKLIKLHVCKVSIWLVSHIYWFTESLVVAVCHPDILYFHPPWAFSFAPPSWSKCSTMRADWNAADPWQQAAGSKPSTFPRWVEKKNEIKVRTLVNAQRPVWAPSWQNPAAPSPDITANVKKACEDVPEPLVSRHPHHTQYLLQRCHWSPHSFAGKRETKKDDTKERTRLVKSTKIN